MCCCVWEAWTNADIGSRGQPTRLSFHTHNRIRFLFSQHTTRIHT